jgi:hypothetical protein
MWTTVSVSYKYIAWFSTEIVYLGKCIEMYKTVYLPKICYIKLCTAHLRSVIFEVHSE